jgi:hypothetical protein
MFGGFLIGSEYSNGKTRKRIMELEDEVKFWQGMARTKGPKYASEYPPQKREPKV